ncbi:MAG: family 78 glycoside hydrolase catalytic domain [Paenibacillaceae bacterium]|nr:family 78 glycoside hydrolase catalytic domain [Paenibacillaceae bacterium]
MIHVPAFWHPHPSREQNVYIAFQANLRLPASQEIAVHLFGCDTYRLYCDGEEAGEGPARFAEARPEYDVYSLALPAGEHTLTIVVHYYGVATRMSANRLPPFVQVEVLVASGPFSLIWRCQELAAFRPMGRRINGQLGWAELCDTRLLPDWSVDEAGAASSVQADWHSVAFVEPWEGRRQPVYGRNPLAACRNDVVPSAMIGSGVYTDRFGYEMDDPPVRFLLRDFQTATTADGVWYRFDFGKVGLYRPALDLELPEGTKVEAGYSEYLTDGRVVPVITFSASSSCHLDRWIAKGGRQTLSTFSPRGFRFLELHIAAPLKTVAIHEVAARQRTYFGSPIGRFTSSDPLLDRIWRAGVETLQACSEDALTDTPTRERGQWLGDAVAVGMETLGVAYGDLSLIRRSLEQAALSRRDDGMIMGCYPGQIIPVSSYAMLWVTGCMRYFRLTGDKAFVRSHFQAANDVVDFYLSCLSEVGIARFPYWDFVDWGHIVAKDEVNVALNVLVWKALGDAADWADALGEAALGRQRLEQRDHLEAIIRGKLMTARGLLPTALPIDGGADEASSGAEPGYHANVLALAFGLFCGEERQTAAEWIKQHMRSCFPNRPDAPRLSHPAANHPQLITPYFGHFALAALLDEGEADFVLDQYRTCWGWMLEQGATTLLEVFDLRWSHCHAWSGCPSWQLSRYFLGLQAISAGEGEGEPCLFEFRLLTGSLTHAAGEVPIVGTSDKIRISWRRTEEGISYECDSDREIAIRFPSASHYRLTLLEPQTDAASSNPLTTRGFRCKVLLN